jgi:ArsR family transcriptional regulator
MSHRLRLLRSDGLVRSRRDGRHIYYALSDDHVVELIANALAHAAEPSGVPGTHSPLSE